MKFTGWILVALLAFAALGCSGQRSDQPAEGSAADESLKKGIPRSATSQSTQQPETPKVSE